MLSNGIEPILLWVWIVMAIFFFVTEIFTAGFVLLCFGIGALLGALATFLGLGLVWQLIAFIVGSGIAVLLARPFSERVSQAGVQNIAIDRVLNKEAIVLQPIDPMTNRGMVRVETEEWRAESVDGLSIDAGERVDVIGVDGVRLQVRRRGGSQKLPPV